MQELLKMFNDSDSFFYSPTGDLTNTLQRQFSGKYDQNEPLWKRVRILTTVKINVLTLYSRGKSYVQGGAIPNKGIFLGFFVVIMFP